MSPKISIITVCLNDKAGLEKTIQSVLEQTFVDLEYIIIDGGSSDGTIDVIKKNEAKITHWVSEKDNGIYQAMNKAINLSAGEYCLFLNAGDFLSDKHVLKNVFSKNFTDDIIYGNMLYDNGTSIEQQEQPEKITFFHLFTKYLFHPSTFIKRKLFEEIGNYNEKMKIASDYDFIFRAIVIHRATTQYVPIFISQHNNKGISSRPENFPLVMKERSEVHKKYLPKMVVDEMSDYFLSANNTSFKYLASLKNHPLRRKIAQIVLRVLSKNKVNP